MNFVHVPRCSDWRAELITVTHCRTVVGDFDNKARRESQRHCSRVRQPSSFNIVVTLALGSYLTIVDLAALRWTISVLWLPLFLWQNYIKKPIADLVLSSATNG